MFEESKHKAQEDQYLSAAQKGSLDDCKKFISIGIDVNSRDRSGSTALFLCCHPQNLKLYRFLLNSGLNPNLANNRGNTALHLACEKSYPEVVLILLLYGADPNIYNLNGFRCDDVNPLMRPLIAGIVKDRSAYGLLSEFHRKKLTQIFEEIDLDDRGFVDFGKCSKFNRFVDEISEDVSKRDAMEFLREVSICREGQVNLEEWLLSFGKLIRESTNEAPVDQFIEDFERAIKERGSKFADYKPRD
jgi:hypothetical protein